MSAHLPVFFQPVWLLLIIPLAVAWWIWPLPGRWLKALRAVIFLLIILALAELAIRLPDRAGTVVVVADRSESMPANAAASEKEIIGLLHKSMRPRDQLGVISFGRKAAVEQSPQRGEFGGFTAQVGADHSRLNAALESALSLMPPDGSGRILVLSDGRWTGRNPSTAAARAAGRGVAVDYRLLSRPQTGDVAIQNFLAPSSVQPGEAFTLNCWVQSPVEQKIRYQLKRGDDILSAGTKQIPAGRSRLIFRDRASQSGVNEYVVTIQGTQDDPVPENNSARALVGVQGSRPILVVSSAGENSGLVKLLRAGELDVVGKTPNQCQWSLEDLSQYSSVVLENVPAGKIGRTGMETLADWVTETGSGLELTGGQKSYGPGGYYKSPLDHILPVSMELRQEQRKFNVAVVIALDRSGSMSMPAGGGRIKMDLADLGTVQVLDLLSPMDEIGVFAVDTKPHEIVPLDTVEHNRAYRGKILAIGSMGGGIYIHEALVACARMISTAKAKTKHIILFADAADSEQSMNYKEIVDKLREAGVTISVVGLGTDHDVDANLLKDIAKRGGGECYFSDNPDDIPRIFAQDTFTVARSTFVDQPTPFQFTAGYSLLGSLPDSPPPSLGGYNLCYIRPQANLAAVTEDEYSAPVVASWNAGSGRVLCYLGEADGKYSGKLAKWKQVGEFHATLARWVAGRHQPLPNDMLLTQEIRDGVCIVQLHLDPARRTEPISTLPQVKVLHGIPGTAPQKETVPLQWKNADLLEATIPVGGRETILNTVEIAGQQPVTLPAACLPYSPEYAPAEPGRGATTLEQIAMTTGGKERVEISKIWNELPVKSRFVAMAPWLLVLATVLFLLEILERRTGWVSRLVQRQVVQRAPAETEETETSAPVPVRKPVLPWLTRKPQQRKRSAPAPVQASPSTPESPQSSSKTTPAQTSSESESAIDALRKARERASRRTDKHR